MSGSATFTIVTSSSKHEHPGDDGSERPPLVGRRRASCGGEAAVSMLSMCSPFGPCFDSVSS
jgi:hypothetical protein